MKWTEMLKPETVTQLRANWEEQKPLKGTLNEKDFEPVCKLFNPYGPGTWLITECDEDGLCFGLADMGYPEMGYIDLQEIADVRLLGGAGHIEQDLHFQSSQTIGQYAEEARQLGYIRA